MQKNDIFKLYGRKHNVSVIENGTDIDIVLESMARIDTASTIKTAALQEKQSGEKYFINNAEIID